MKRIIITGTSGSGKTTLGKILSKQLDIPYIDLDDLFWLPNWTLRPHEEFVKLLEEAAKQPGWIICGNQSKVRPLFWPQADTVIFLDLPLFLLVRRVFWRGIIQFKNKELICNGNRQSLKQFLWLLYWVFSSYHRRKRTYQTLWEQTTHLYWIHLKTEREIHSFIKNLKIAQKDLL